MLHLCVISIYWYILAYSLPELKFEYLNNLKILYFCLESNKTASTCVALSPVRNTCTSDATVHKLFHARNTKLIIYSYVPVQSLMEIQFHLTNLLRYKIFLTITIFVVTLLMHFAAYEI